MIYYLQKSKSERKSIKMKKLISLLIVVAVLALSACNTSNAAESDTASDIYNNEENTSISESTKEETSDDESQSENDASSDEGSTSESTDCKTHTDNDNNGYCDNCDTYLIITFDFFAINDLHGKFKDTSNNVGVDELTTYLKNAKKSNNNTFILSSGDMWQGSSESNLTKGALITEWMNDLDFVSMTLGNHEFDWGEEMIKANSDIADFPFLAINVYDKDTNKRVEYCKSSIVIDTGYIQIGIIGAIGDCYSSISSDKTKDIYFKVGDELTSLVKEESERLRDDGVDYIIYSLHDGYTSKSSSPTSIPSSKLEGYYDSELSQGNYIDLVFEGHTHQSYIYYDSHEIYHMQNGGENNGISHASVDINYITFNSSIKEAEIVSYKEYSKENDDPIVNELLEKYKDTISKGEEALGYLTKKMNSGEIAQLVSKLYYEFGEKTWGDKYDLALGGGFISVRSPYKLNAGNVTYSDVQAILPFDNNLVLCSVSGRDLKEKFFETKNDRYYISYGDYGESIKNNIDLNATYYIVVDTYTSTYAPNNLTEIERYEYDVFARDLLAEYIKQL